MATTYSTLTFQTAKENMVFDKHIQSTIQHEDTVFRLYNWMRPGITYSYKQQLPEHLATYDNAKRLTGGGIVFHSPGDLVMCIKAPMSRKKNLKQNMAVITEATKHVFSTFGITLTHETKQSSVDHDFCAAYPNPFELFFNGQKVLALTLRNYRKDYVIQGILHLNDNTTYFNAINEEYHAFLTKGLQGKSIDNIQVKLALFEAFTRGIYNDAKEKPEQATNI